ncbi:MAG: AAA family ATPase [Synergistaceae bacterium]|nr:AAA family ATPase [Synergistaceae bacterium]
MKVVSIINYKGGVGKTTVTSNLAAYVAQQGKRVLMIDLDPQTNLTLAFLNQPEWESEYAEKKTLLEFFRPIIKGSSKRIPLSDLVIHVEPSGLGLDLISSHLELIDIDTDLAACLGGGNPDIMAHNFLKVHSHLKEGLLGLKGEYDLVLIDCPPNFNTVVKNAITASDWYLVPAKMDYLSTLGLDHLRRSTKKYVEDYNDHVRQTGDDEFSLISPAILGIVPTMLTIHDGAPIKAHQFYITKLKADEERNYHLFPWLRHNSTLYAFAPANGVPIILSPSPGASGDNVLEELQALGKAFMEKAGI